MDRQCWHRDVECQNCGELLRVFKEDLIRTSHVFRENQPICFVDCPGCNSTVDIGKVPKAILQKVIG